MKSAPDAPVAVTAVGLVAGCGIDAETCWQAFGKPPPPPRAIQRFATADLGAGLAHEVDGWDPSRFWNRRTAAYSTRSAQFALKAAQECLQQVETGGHAGLGIVLGTQFATLHNFHQVLSEPDYMTPLKFLSALPSSIPTNVSIACHLRGISTSVSSSVAGLEAVSYGAELVRDGYLPAVLAGGAEELSQDLYAFCSRAGALAVPGASAGLVLGEAAGLLLLETLAHAAGAGRAPLALLAGWGAAYAPAEEDAGDEAGAHALAGALALAGLEIDQIGAVLCGANGSPECDARQAAALARLGGRGVPVLALKDWTGEVFGAFGAIAVAVAALALARQTLPGDAAPRAAPLEAVLIYDNGWDGNHAAMVLQRIPKGEPTNGPV